MDWIFLTVWTLVALSVGYLRGLKELENPSKLGSFLISWRVKVLRRRWLDAIDKHYEKEKEDI